MEPAVSSTAARKSTERKASKQKLADPPPAGSKRPEQKPPLPKQAGPSKSPETKPPGQKPSDGKRGAQAGAAGTKAPEPETGSERVSTDFKPIDGMGMASDLTRLRGMNNPLEVVKWTYLSPPLEEERKGKDIRTAVFWSGGKPPKQRDLEKEKELAKLIIPKPGDKDYCVLKYGNIPSPRPDYCVEHGWITGPESVQPLPKPDLPEKVVTRLDMVGIDKTSLAECGIHGDLKINIFVEAEVVETFDKWDVRKDTIILPCGYGRQPLRWLGQAACIRVAFLKNEPSSKFLPLAIKSADGIALDPDMSIRDVLWSGAKVIIDYSNEVRQRPCENGLILTVFQSCPPF